MTIYIKADFLKQYSCADDNVITKTEAKALKKELKAARKDNPQAQASFDQLQQLFQQGIWDQPQEVRLRSAAVRLCSEQRDLGGFNITQCSDGSDNQLFNRQIGGLSSCSARRDTGGYDYQISSVPANTMARGAVMNAIDPDLEREDYIIFTDGRYNFCFEPESTPQIDALMVEE